MSSYPDIAASLAQSLKLTQPPVAMCLADAVPGTVAHWSGPSPTLAVLQSAG
jgi:hypothetical protein